MASGDQPADELMGKLGDMSMEQTMDLLGSLPPAAGGDSEHHAPLGDAAADAVMGYSQMGGGSPGASTLDMAPPVAATGAGSHFVIDDDDGSGGMMDLPLTDEPIAAATHGAGGQPPAGVPPTDVPGIGGGAGDSRGDAGGTNAHGVVGGGRGAGVSATGQAAAGSTAAAPTLPRSGGGSEQLDAPVRICVGDPDRVEGTNSLGIKTSHWEYSVRTDSSLPAMLASGMEVKRRYNDFDSLHKLLHSEWRGCFIPPLPHKSILENSADEFLRLRRADLQAYLRAIVAHPQLIESEALKVFLLQPGALHRNPAWLNLVKPAPTPTTTSQTGGNVDGGDGDGTGASNSKALLGSLMSWMKASTKTLLPTPKRELPADEALLRQSTEHLVELNRLLTAATSAARSLCAHMDVLASDCHDLFSSLEDLASFEETQQSVLGQYTPGGQSAANRAVDFAALAKATSAQSNIWKHGGMRSAGHLVTLHDQHILIPEAIAALREREAALEDVFALEDELAEKRATMQALQAPPGSVAGAGTKLTAEQRANRQLALAQSIDKLAESIAAAREVYETVKSRNQADLSRLGLEREHGFKRMATAFAMTQARMVQSSAEHWVALEKALTSGTTAEHVSM